MPLHASLRGPRALLSREVRLQTKAPSASEATTGFAVQKGGQVNTGRSLMAHAEEWALGEHEPRNAIP